MIRQYTTDWGGVDTGLNEERKQLISSLKEHVSSNRKKEDVDHVLDLRRAVRVKASTLDEIGVTFTS